MVEREETAIIGEALTGTCDNRGRINLGADLAGERITVMVVETHERD